MFAMACSAGSFLLVLVLASFAIGALAFGHLPAILVPAGPMTTGLSNSEKSHMRVLAAEGKVGRKELLAQAKRGEVVVLDVRPPEEFDTANLPYARSVPLPELAQRLSLRLPHDAAPLQRLVFLMGFTFGLAIWLPWPT